MCSVSLSAGTSLKHVEVCGDVPRPLEIHGHGETLLENGKMEFSIDGEDTVLSSL